MKVRKERQVFYDFIEEYDKEINESKQQNFLKLINIVLAAFIIIAICLISVRP